MSHSPYRGRIAPSPTGYLHLGHARTFWMAQERAQARNGVLILRNEDLDTTRCRAEFVSAMTEDLRWFGFRWQEGPDCGGAFGPYSQSERRSSYVAALQKLLDGGFVYPCNCSRQDVLRALSAPHADSEEPVYPGTCRPSGDGELKVQNEKLDGSAAEHALPSSAKNPKSKKHINWRFRVPDGETISFIDGNFGPQQFVAGKDFGDFVVWRHDDIPAYQLAVVADDAAMQITEVVRGADLLMSTARQILLYRVLNFPVPAFFHCHLMNDEKGIRLAKRHDALSLRALRNSGATPELLRQKWG